MKTHWHPGKLLSASSAYWQGCTLQAGVKLRVFSMLGKQLSTASELADKIESDPYATTLLLDALSGMELLEKDGDKYRNSKGAGMFLDENSDGYMGHIILHHYHLLDGWAQLYQVIKTGEPISRRSFGQEVERESFIMGMFNLAMQIAPEIAAQIDLSNKQKLLDLGGGPGTYSIHFCKENKDLRAVVFDRPTTAPFAKETVARFGLTDRIDFVGGDFTMDPISGGPYDVAWLSHILHSNTLEECNTIITNTVKELEKGAVILIHDFILNDSKDGPEFPALFSLNMLLANNGGRSYSQQEIFEMLEQAGVTTVERHPFQAKNDSSIVIGTV